MERHHVRERAGRGSAGRRLQQLLSVVPHPDGTWIAFARASTSVASSWSVAATACNGQNGDGVSYDNPSSSIWVTPATGGTPVRLDSANDGMTLTNSWPKWAPKADGEYLWMCRRPRRDRMASGSAGADAHHQACGLDGGASPGGQRRAVVACGVVSVPDAHDQESRRSVVLQGRGLHDPVMHRLAILIVCVGLSRAYADPPAPDPVPTSESAPVPDETPAAKPRPKKSVPADPVSVQTPWYTGPYATNRFIHLAITAAFALYDISGYVFPATALTPSSCRWCTPPSFDRAVRNELVWSNKGRADTLSTVGAYVLAPIVGLTLLIASDKNASATRLIDDVLPVAETVAIVQVSNT